MTDYLVFVHQAGFPGGINSHFIRSYTNDPDKDISMAAIRTSKYWEKRGF